MVLYLDLVIFKEFIMDFILLITTKTVLKKQTNILSIIISSLIGTIATMVDVIVEIYNPIRLIANLLVSIIMIKVIFKTKDIKEFTKEILTFYLISFCFAGISTSIMFSESLNNIIKTRMVTGKYSETVLILTVVLGVVLVYFTLKTICLNIRKDNMICDLEICIDSKVINTKVLIDTGNLLKEPITNMPVIIIQKNILGKELLKISKDKKIYLIPYKTLGKENKVLFGIKPEYIKINAISAYTLNNVIIGLYDGKIDENNLYFGLMRNRNIRKGEWSSMKMIDKIKREINLIYFRCLKQNKIGNMPIFYINGGQILPPPLRTRRGRASTKGNRKPGN